VVARNLNIPAIHQRLLFQGVALRVLNDAGKQLTLQDYEIQNGATLLCMRLLFTINKTDDLDHVVFNLIWGYPKKGRDFLDGTCLVYENSDYLFPINFGHRRDVVTGGALFHSGDVMGPKSGRHTINLSLRSLPKNISHLFFTLSAFAPSNLSQFINPSITLCRQGSPDKPLLEYVLQHAGFSEALIMCCLVRNAKDGEWSVVALGKPSRGDVSNYNKMNETISSLFKDKMFAS
jgi:stress response protein SCP2